ncbi:hypothetical protein BGZ61DRAFT_520503 [Ilyonectria robusta]|uniref:uncharacterized protein n=1 Tax=Ilyonectria robusta TaxID=1079257 RepID=UPI001E8E0156|nr:uncharacterized protein BGZ61DRAFT_520503 [Ilyonectria robusta]KAH8676902.1 hypothetical protein BGZ61DRAFT_520503 [Ilyonectria robusta]
MSGSRFDDNGSSPPPSTASPSPPPASPPRRPRPQSAPSTTRIITETSFMSTITSTSECPPYTRLRRSTGPGPDYARLSLGVQIGPGADVQPVDMYFHRSWEAARGGRVLHFRDDVVRLPRSFERHADPWVRLEAPVRLFNNGEDSSGDDDEEDYIYESSDGYDDDDDDASQSSSSQDDNNDNNTTTSNPALTTPHPQPSARHIIINTITGRLLIALLATAFFSPWFLLPPVVPLPIHYPIADANAAIYSLSDDVDTVDWSLGQHVVCYRTDRWSPMCADDTPDAGQPWDRELWGDEVDGGDGSGKSLPRGAEKTDVCAMVEACRVLNAGLKETKKSLKDLEFLSAKGEIKDLVSTLITSLSLIAKGKDEDEEKDKVKAKEAMEKDIITLYLDSLNQFYVSYEDYEVQVPDHTDEYGYADRSSHHKRRNPLAWKTKKGWRQLKHTVAERMAHSLIILDGLIASIKLLQHPAAILANNVYRFQCAEGEQASIAGCFDPVNHLPEATQTRTRIASLREALEEYRDRIDAAMRQMRALQAGLTLVAGLRDVHGVYHGANSSGISSGVPNELDIWTLLSIWTGNQETGTDDPSADQQRWKRRIHALAMTTWTRLLPQSMRPNTHFRLPSIRAQQLLFNDSTQAVARAGGWTLVDPHKGCEWC